MKNRTIIFVLAWLLLSLTSWMAAQTQTNLPAEKISKIETAITSFMARQNIPGGERTNRYENLTESFSIFKDDLLR